MNTPEERLKTALAGAFFDIAWNAYCTGHVDKDGWFDNCCMSDPEWLQWAITGCRKRSKDIPSAWLKDQMSELAEAMVAAVVAGEEPYGASLNRTPE